MSSSVKATCINVGYLRTNTWANGGHYSTRQNSNAICYMNSGE